MPFRVAALIGLALALTAWGAPGSGCRAGCRGVRAAARSGARVHLTSCVQACGTRTGAERRSCRSTCRRTRRESRRAAQAAFRAGMAACRSEGTDAVGCPAGGGSPGRCPARPGLPTTLSYTVPRPEAADPATRGDLDRGFSGESHNFPAIQGVALQLCLAGCDVAADPMCQASGATGTDTANGPTFGPPQPVLTSGVPVCVVNRYDDPQVTGTYDLQTGDMSVQLGLLSDVYVLTDATMRNVCPRCTGDGTIGSSGVCVGGRSDGRPCVVQGLIDVVGAVPPTHQLSGDCLPSESSLGGTFPITLLLTSGTSAMTGSRPCPGQLRDDYCGTDASCTVDCSATPPSRGGINQRCCSDEPLRPCFPTAPDSGGAIIRTGTAVIPSPPWPDPAYPKTAAGARLAGTFCETRTGTDIVDVTTGLPGPSAILLPGTVSVAAGE